MSGLDQWNRVLNMVDQYRYNGVTGHFADEWELADG